MQITNYRNAVAKLKGILDNRASYLIIHYSCESFRERNQAKSPRITSIAIRSLESGQIESFSIHKIAEKKGVPLEQISDHYNELEYDMLCEYMTFLEKRDDKTFIHWNMRDINYGFPRLNTASRCYATRCGEETPMICSPSNSTR